MLLEVNRNVSDPSGCQLEPKIVQFATCRSLNEVRLSFRDSTAVIPRVGGKSVVGGSPDVSSCVRGPSESTISSATGRSQLSEKLRETSTDVKCVSGNTEHVVNIPRPSQVGDISSKLRISNCSANSLSLTIKCSSRPLSLVSKSALHFPKVVNSAQNSLFTKASSNYSQHLRGNRKSYEFRKSVPNTSRTTGVARKVSSSLKTSSEREFSQSEDCERLSLVNLVDWDSPSTSTGTVKRRPSRLQIAKPSGGSEAVLCSVSSSSDTMGNIPLRSACTKSESTGSTSADIDVRKSEVEIDEDENKLTEKNSCVSDVEHQVEVRGVDISITKEKQITEVDKHSECNSDDLLEFRLQSDELAVVSDNQETEVSVMSIPKSVYIIHYINCYNLLSYSKEMCINSSKYQCNTTFIY